MIPESNARNDVRVQPASGQLDLVRAFERGLGDPDGYFVHGTSLAALRIARIEGFLPGGRHPGLLGRLYCNPIPSRFQYECARADIPTTDEDAMRGAVSYARISEIGAQVLHHLGIDKPGEAILLALGELPLTRDDLSCKWFDSEEQKSLRNLGLSDVDLHRILSCCGAGAGVVLLFSKELLSDFQIQEADEKDEGLFISVPAGVATRYIVGIAPQSDDGLKYFEELQRITKG